MFISPKPQSLQGNGWRLDTVFILNKVEINTKPNEPLVTKMSSEVNICYELKKEHLICEKSQHQI